MDSKNNLLKRKHPFATKREKSLQMCNLLYKRKLCKQNKTTVQMVSGVRNTKGDKRLDIQAIL